MITADGSPQRGRLGGGWRELLAVVVAFGVLTAAMTYPLAFRLGSIGRTDGADGQYSIWNVAWVARALVLDPLHVFDANVFYPHQGTLLYSEAKLVSGALAIPAYWLTRSPYVANNFVTLLSFVLAGMGAYYLVRYLTQDRMAAVISGICFAYCPYVFAHLPHVQLLMTAGLPFGMLAFHRLADHPTPLRGFVLGLVMALEALACGYYGIFVMLMIGFSVLLVATTRSRWTDVPYWKAVIVAAVVSVGGVLPLFVPYMSLQRATGFVRPLAGGQQFAAEWQSYLASSAYAHAWMLPWLGHWTEVAFPGFVATILGVMGAAFAWRGRGREREAALLYAGLGGLALWASFGPSAGLYTAMYYTVPGFTFIHGASRFCIVVVFALSTLAGFAMASFLRQARTRVFAGVVLGVVAIAELFVSYPFRPVPAVEPAYRVLATMPRGAVLEMPVYSRQFGFLRARYMLASTAHWMPLVDGYSDYIPTDFAENLDALGGFPSREAFAYLAPNPIRYAVFHVDAYPPEARVALDKQIVEFAPYLRKLWTDDGTWLYEVTGSPQ